jgi:translation initiation factor 1 (eIF-1/SUI1)
MSTRIFLSERLDKPRSYGHRKTFVHIKDFPEALDLRPVCKSLKRTFQCNGTIFEYDGKRMIMLATTRSSSICEDVHGALGLLGIQSLIECECNGH